jgi:hypothetical protein
MDATEFDYRELAIKTLMVTFAKESSSSFDIVNEDEALELTAVATEALKRLQKLEKLEKEKLSSRFDMNIPRVNIFEESKEIDYKELTIKCHMSHFFCQKKVPPELVVEKFLSYEEVEALKETGLEAEKRTGKIIKELRS